MTTQDFIQYVAVPFGAAIVGAAIGGLLAFRYQNRMELKRDKRIVLQTLMIYRNVGAQELEWIKALNAIDLVFNSNSEIIELYHTMIAQLTPELIETGRWRETYFLMLQRMAVECAYPTLTLQQVRDFYAPNALQIHYPNMNVNSLPTAPNPADLPPANHSN